MKAANYRRRIVEAVIARLLPLANVRACFEAGSAATGRLDDYSDVDLVIVTPLSAADAAFSAVEAALGALAEITHRWIVDPPPFADSAQRFYFLADAPRYFAVDCVVITEAAVEQLLERERHGEPLVYFDRTGRIRPRPADPTALAARRAKRRTQLAGAVPIYAMLVDKELARGRPLDAYGFYQALLRQLIEVLGMQYRPDRFDFGWRYVETDLPPDERALLAHLAFVASDDLLKQRADELAQELERRLEALAG
jgi:predicted nucleotidyltransferase